MYGGNDDTIGIIVRVDSTTGIVSGDVYFRYQNPNDGEIYYDMMFSFISVDAPATSIGSTHTITGNMNFFQYTTLAGTLSITFDGVSISLSMSLQDKLSQRTPTVSNINLEKFSDYYRRLNLEIDHMAGTQVPEVFDTSTIANKPNHLPDQNITIQSAFQKAGIDMQISVHQNSIPADLNALWNDSELHAIMEQNMHDYPNYPSWRLYLLIATYYIDPDVLGIMYDSNDNFPRQGSAVFYGHYLINGNDTPAKKREYLFTAVHELGHALNMYHSFHKGIDGVVYGVPVPQSLSFMNYPHLYPYGSVRRPGWNGEDDFWSKFHFTFDESELIHLRHHDYYEVIPGGYDFGSDGHFTSASHTKNLRLVGSLKEIHLDSSHVPLELKLRSKKSFELGEQVIVEAKLKNIQSKPLQVFSSLNLKNGFLKIIVTGPDGKMQKYSPLFIRCGKFKSATLESGKSIYEDIYLNYGKHGFYFKQSGTYKIQGIVEFAGSFIKSSVHEITILDADSKREKSMLLELFGRNQGHYFCLKGSDYLMDTEIMLSKLKSQMEDSKVSRFIEFYKGSRLSKNFKTIQNDGAIHTRESDSINALKEMTSAVQEDSSGEIVFSNILLNNIMNEMCDLQVKLEHSTDAKDILKQLMDTLTKRKVSRNVIADLETKYDEI